MTQVVITKAQSNGEYEEFAKLIRAYIDWCRVRYEEHLWTVEMAFSYQDLDKELEQLSTSYGSPNGTTLLAMCDEQIQGWCGLSKAIGKYLRNEAAICS